jgi:hypothetical protein
MTHRLIVFFLTVLTAVSAVAQASQTYSITVEARQISQSGPDAIPPNATYLTVFKNRTLYLMDVDPDAALKASGIPSPGFESYDGNNEKSGAGVSDFVAALEASERGFSGGSHYLKEFYGKAFVVLKPHLVQKVVTDSQGKAVFTSVKAGVYHIMGSAGNPNPQVWNRRIEITNSPATIVLQ